MNVTGECCFLKGRVASGREGLFIGMAGDSAAAVRNGVKQREAAGCARCTRLSHASRGRYRSGERCDQLGLRLGTNSRRRGGTYPPRLMVPSLIRQPVRIGPVSDATEWRPTDGGANTDCCSNRQDASRSDGRRPQVLEDRCADGLNSLRREVNAPRGEIRRNQLRCLVLALVPSGSYPSK
jgi:hypothetical protein